MVGVVDCYNKELTENAQERLEECSHDYSLDSSNQSRYSNIRNCSVLSPGTPRKRIIEPVSHNFRTATSVF